MTTNATPSTVKIQFQTGHIFTWTDSKCPISDLADDPVTHVQSRHGLCPKFNYQTADVEEVAGKINPSGLDVVAMVPKDCRVPDNAIEEKLFALHGNKISNYTIGEAVVVLRERVTDSATLVMQRTAAIKPPVSVSSNTVAAESEKPFQTGDPNPDIEPRLLQQKKEACYQHLLPINGARFENILQFFYSGFVTAGDCVVDVGAHNGRHMLPLAKVVRTEACVYAFEPIPELYDGLKEVIAQDNLKYFIELSNSALSNHTGSTTFRLIQDAPGLSGLKERQSHEGHEVKEIQVRVEKLDDLIPPETRIRFIKVDAEGANSSILKRRSRIMMQDRPVVGFESGRVNALPAESYDYTEEEFNTFF